MWPVNLAHTLAVELMRGPLGQQGLNNIIASQCRQKCIIRYQVIKWVRRHCPYTYIEQL